MENPIKPIIKPTISPLFKSGAFKNYDIIGKVIRDLEAPLRVMNEHATSTQEVQKHLAWGRTEFEKLIPSPRIGTIIASMMEDVEERQKLFRKQIQPIIASELRLGASLARYFESLAIPSEEIRRTLESLSLSIQTLGEIPIEFDPDEENSRELEGNIGEEATNRLIQVDFLPIHLVQAIIRDPKILLQTSAREFEKRMAALLDKLGFENVYLTQQSKDGGIDIWASHTFNGIPSLFAFDCKRWSPSRKIEFADMKVMLGTIETAKPRPDKGVILTTSTFTKGAWRLVAEQTNLWGRDLNGIIEWMKAVQNLNRK